MSNAQQFGIELDEWFEGEVEEGVVTLTKAIGLQALRGVVLKTPVDTGRARGNWSVTLGAPDSSTSESDDKSGGAAIAAGSASILGMQTAMIVYIQNNLPYIEALENGHSTQAPAGMVAVTVAEIEAGFAR